MLLLFQRGAIQVMCRHVQLKGNVYYFRRRVPEDVRSLHRHSATKQPQEQLFFSLKTSDKLEACRRADSHTRRLDALWKAHREGCGSEAKPTVSLAKLEAAKLAPGDGKRFRDHPAISDFVDDLVGPYEPDEPVPVLSAQDRLTLDILYGEAIPRTLTDAREKHFELGKGPKGKAALQQFERAWAELIAITGDITLDNLRREHANEFVRALYRRGVGPATITRNLTHVRPVINTAILEFELTMNNPFNGVTIPNRDEGPRKPRETFTLDELATIRRKCRAVNDQRRWAISMLSDTMCRLSEIVGLRKEDVILDVPVPHIRVRWTEERRLKTRQSERLVPLVGEALWAARRGMMTEGPYLFPVFQPKRQGKDFNPNGASATLNKWLKENNLAREGQTIHSFRHTMRDRLRDSEAQPDLIDRIGGWSARTVGEGYGKGHSLEVMQRYMLKTVIDRGSTSSTDSRDHAA
jgi:integrase